MEELANKLAELQAELKAEESKADEASILIDAEITELHIDLSFLEEQREMSRLPHHKAAEELKTTIGDLQQTIIDEWDGEKKTLKFDAGTLKFRTTQKLEIHNESLLLEGLMDNLPTAGYIIRYLKGFNLTKLKEYMKTYPQPDSIVELIPTTTVKLELSGD